ncbi:MAG: PH domain-containing protein [Acidobacteriota bacterium]|nr:PH domain-containing protein [Acidobacteriota bacterium]
MTEPTPRNAPNAPATEALVYAIERPHPNLLTYYVTRSLITGPFLPLVLFPQWLKYRTLRYAFDDEGVSMRWGALFRRETRLNYGRLQDIHLSSNAVERWLGLAKVQLQTASGSAKPEMILEGIPEYELVRDFLYHRMQGTRRATPQGPDSTRHSTPEPLAEVAQSLRAVAHELSNIRALLEKGERGGSGPEPKR